MVKAKLIIFFTLLLLTSCIFYKKNEFGFVRVEKSRFKAFEKMGSTKIDTSKYYRLKSIFHLRNDKSWQKYKNLKDNFSHGIYYKFYYGGKFAYFDNFQEKSMDFNPKKSYMGYYGSTDNKLYLQYYRPSEPGSWALCTEEIYLYKDSIVTIWDGIEGNVLVPVEVSNKCLSCRPDW